MAMEIGGVTGAYQSAAVGMAASRAMPSGATGNESSQAKAANATDRSARSNDTGAASQTKEYLKSLREKYSDVNITVADFKSEKQELSYMLGCSGGNNIVISSSIIEKMAKDPAAAEKYEKVIADVPNASKEIKESLEAMGSEYIASGTRIDKNGKVSYWCVGSKTTEGPGTKEKMQKQLEEKRAERKEQEKAAAKRKEKHEKQEKIEQRRNERKFKYIEITKAGSRVDISA